jgi:hypothetical protein
MSDSCGAGLHLLYQICSERSACGEVLVPWCWPCRRNAVALVSEITEYVSACHAQAYRPAAVSSLPTSCHEGSSSASWQSGHMLGVGGSHLADPHEHCCTVFTFPVVRIVETPAAWCWWWLVRCVLYQQQSLYVACKWRTAAGSANIRELVSTTCTAAAQPKDILYMIEQFSPGPIAAGTNICTYPSQWVPAAWFQPGNLLGLISGFIAGALHSTVLQTSLSMHTPCFRLTSAKCTLSHTQYLLLTGQPAFVACVVSASEIQRNLKAQNHMSTCSWASWADNPQ